MAHAGKWPGDGAAEHRLAGESLIWLRDGYHMSLRDHVGGWNEGYGIARRVWEEEISAYETQILRSSKLMAFDFLMQ